MANLGTMSHNWVIVKNSKKGGHRDRPEFQADLENSLREFESAGGFKVDRSVRETIGAIEFNYEGEREKVYTHPFPHISSHGEYLFGCFSVPADIDNGTADFSSLFFVATETRLLTVFKDPSWVFNGTFGGAVLSLYNRHEESQNDRVSQTLLKLVGFTIAALDHTFDALGNRSEKYEDRVFKISQNDGKAIESSISRYLPPLIILKDEIQALKTVTTQTVAIMSRIENSRVELNPASEQPTPFFNNAETHYANGLLVHASQVDSYRDALLREVTDSIQKLDRMQDKALVLATHRVTALGAMILFPNLIFDFFGQAFEPLPPWFRSNGWWFTVFLTVAYWVIQYAWLRRRRYI